MNHPFQRVPICDGVHFSSIIDSKFKHNRITANLVLELERNAVTDRALVPFLLRKGCESYPDFTKLNQRLCELYGASLSCDVSKFGGYQVLDVSIYGIDDRFTLGGEEMIAACSRLLSEVLLNPKLINGLFSEEDVKLETQQLIDVIESQINDKRAYAMTRCKSEMCKGETVAIEKYGYIEDAQKITPQSVTDAYHAILKQARIELMFVGCGNPEPAKETFTQAFTALKRTPVEIGLSSGKPSADKVNEVTEELDVSQSKLVMGMRTGKIADRRGFAAMRMMTALFGGTPSSRLFVYVREKLSLCYYCAARFDRFTGLLMVDSGVSKANKQKACDEILNQLEIIKRGEFTDDDITATRLTVQNSLRTVTDSLGGMEEWYMTQIMSGNAYSPAEDSELLESITREEIIAAAKQVSLDTIYFLTGKEAE